MNAPTEKNDKGHLNKNPVLSSGRLTKGGILIRRVSGMATKTQPITSDSNDDGILSTMNKLQEWGGFKKDWAELWKNFQANQTNKEWWARRPKNEPVYRLPKDLLIELGAQDADKPEARSKTGRKTYTRRRKAILEQKELEAEHAFLRLCQDWRHDCVGVLAKRPLLNTLADDRLSTKPLSDDFLLDCKFIQKMGLKKFRKSMEILESKSVRYRRLLRQRVGQLLCESSFVRESLSLKALHQKLSKQFRFPLTRHFCIREKPLDENAMSPSAQEVAFHEKIKEFLNKWELTGLDSFEMPVPLGPLAEVPVRIPINNMGEVVLSKLYPSYWPLTDKEGGEIAARLEVRNSKQLPPVETYLRKRPGLYEQVYEMRLTELSFISRYVKRRGFVGRLIQVYSEQYGVSSDRIKQVREKYIPNLPQT